jgi:hypothetical protein
MSNIQVGYGHGDVVGIPFDFYGGATLVTGSTITMQTNQLLLSNTTGGAIAVTINLPLNPVDGCCAEISNVSPAAADVLTITAINANTGDVIATSGLGVPATITVAASTAGGSAAATVKYKYTLNGFQPASGAAVNPRTWFRVQ